MTKLSWFERKFQFGLPAGMLPFYLERLEGAIARMHERISGHADSTLAHRLDNKWSVKQNMGHLAEVDEVSVRRIDEIVSGRSPMSPAVFETTQDYNAQPAEQVWNYFRQNRLTLLARYRTLTDNELGLSSLHARLNATMTPVDLAWFDAEHDDHHLLRMAEIIHTLQKQPI